MPKPLKRKLLLDPGRVLTYPLPRCSLHAEAEKAVELRDLSLLKVACALASVPALN